MTDDRDGIEIRVKAHMNIVRPTVGVIPVTDGFAFVESPFVLDGIEGDPGYPLAYRHRDTGALATRAELEAAGLLGDEDRSER